MKLSLKKTFILVLVILCFGVNTVLAKEAPIEVKGVQTIGLEKAKALYQEGAVFIDVRESDSWQVGHIEGSVHLDFSAEEFIVLYASDALDRKTPVVFYCESPLINSGAMASFFAAEWGYENVYYFREGFYSWLAADYPINMGATSTNYFSANSQDSGVSIP